MIKRDGFTLIELLIVIAIIAILATLGLINFQDARMRASDTKKKVELTEMKKALRLYYNDYGQYPRADPGSAYRYFLGCGAGLTSPDEHQTCQEDSVCTGKKFYAGGSTCDTATVYMKNMTDFDGATAGFGYLYFAEGDIPDDFRLWTQLDNRSDPEITGSQNRCLTLSGQPAYIPDTSFVVCAD